MELSLNRFCVEVQAVMPGNASFPTRIRVSINYRVWKPVLTGNELRVVVNEGEGAVKPLSQNLRIHWLRDNPTPTISTGSTIVIGCYISLA